MPNEPTPLLLLIPFRNQITQSDTKVVKDTTEVCYKTSPNLRESPLGSEGKSRNQGKAFYSDLCTPTLNHTNRISKRQLSRRIHK